MIQLTIVNGKKEGAHSTARRFPVRIGRAQDADLRLEEEGVWERHLEIALRSAQGFIVSVQPGAVASINGELIQEAVLRNGDIIELGAVRMQFALSPTRSRSLIFRELSTWIALALLCLAQVALIYWLPG